VSVLLDAGAGTLWKFTTKQGKKYGRSEGLAIASLDMFEKGMFSSDKADPHRVDCVISLLHVLTVAIALKEMTDEMVAKGLQITESNPLSGLSGRAALLRRLGTTLEDSPQIFGQAGSVRPGYMLDYLLSHPSTSTFDGKSIIIIPTIWDVLTINLRGIWPEGRTKFTPEGRGLGDVWKVSTLDDLNDGKVIENLPDNRTSITCPISQAYSMALLFSPSSIQRRWHPYRRRESSHRTP